MMGFIHQLQFAFLRTTGRKTDASTPHPPQRTGFCLISRAFLRNAPPLKLGRSGNFSLHSICPLGLLAFDYMDSAVSLLNGDLSIWGVLAMPLGVALCFGPALFVWLKEELGSAEKHKDHQ